MQTITLNSEGHKTLNRLASELENKLNADVVALLGPLRDVSYVHVRTCVEACKVKRSRLAIVLYTGGGSVEVAERIVHTIRHWYSEITFVVPDLALSAGTILAMSGDAIMMDYGSCLGPIDPQLEKGGTFVPALSYLIQYERLVQKARQGIITDAEFAIMRSSFDQAELHRFEMARDLSIGLLKKWLTTYKFKDWHTTEGRGDAVTKEKREERAEQIATILMDHERWGSHGRGIPMHILQEELKLRIDDFGDDPVLSELVHSYHSLLFDYLLRNNLPNLVHSCYCFL